MALVVAHIDLAKAEAAAIAGQVGRVIALGALAFILVVFAVFLLVIGVSLGLGEWVFGSMGWGVIHGVLLFLSVAMAAVLLAIGIAGARIVRWLALAIVIGILVGVLLGLNLPNQLYTYIGDQLGVAVEPGVRPLVVGVLLGLLHRAHRRHRGGRPDERVRGRPVHRHRRADRPRGGPRGVHRDHFRPADRRRHRGHHRIHRVDGADGRRRRADRHRRRGPQEPLHTRPDHRNQQGDARVAAETDAARDRVLAARAALGGELETLEASARAAVDVPAKIRREPLKAAAIAGGAGFLVLGGPRRLFRRAKRAVTGPPEPFPESMLPEQVEKTLRQLGDDGAAVRGALDAISRPTPSRPAATGHGCGRCSS